MREVHPFAPYLPPSPRLLILGTFPSLASIEDAFYYGHPRNQFWKLLSAITGTPAQTRADKERLLDAHGIALWDIVRECRRSEGSLDAGLKEPYPNAIDRLLADYPSIRVVAVTSQTAKRLYRRFFPHLQPPLPLPSPSPAYAVLSFEAKLAAWQRALSFLKDE
ncbi:MAG: DNA-deoxyinosine glycosylase [Campylobacterales bacterium]